VLRRIVTKFDANLEMLVTSQIRERLVAPLVADEELVAVRTSRYTVCHRLPRRVANATTGSERRAIPVFQYRSHLFLLLSSRESLQTRHRTSGAIPQRHHATSMKDSDIYKHYRVVALEDRIS
jgi:hypothetical protein